MRQQLMKKWYRSFASFNSRTWNLFYLFRHGVMVLSFGFAGKPNQNGASKKREKTKSTSRHLTGAEDTEQGYTDYPNSHYSGRACCLEVNGNVSEKLHITSFEYTDTAAMNNRRVRYIGHQLADLQY